MKWKTNRRHFEANKKAAWAAFFDTAEWLSCDYCSISVFAFDQA